MFKETLSKIKGAALAAVALLAFGVCLSDFDSLKLYQIVLVKAGAYCALFLSFWASPLNIVRSREA